MDKNRLHEILTSPYNIKTWRETLLKIFNAKNLYQQPQQIPLPSNDKAESAYEIGRFKTSDEREIGIFQVNLKEGLRLEKNKVGIRQLLKSIYKYDVDGALITFTQSEKWRLSFVSDIRVLNSKGEIVAKETVPKRYTFLLGKGEKTRTASERLLSIAGKTLSLEDIRVAFSVEKMSKSFFDEYKAHYEKFCDYLQDSIYRTTVFRISVDSDANKTEKDKACKPIRDFTKKLLGRLVFLYFVQKKGWLGASTTEYKDGSSEFIRELFISSGANDSFYPSWLSMLFFDTLNKEREKDNFTMPDGRILKIPYLNGGLFDKEKYENDLITLPSILFHNPVNSEDPKQRSFLDFLDSYNFTIYEDSPEEHTVAVDPEMLSHIFENLLEDNKDKGAFYTPKEIVHYMCQESLIEYLTTHLSKEFTVYRQIGSDQIEFFGNETKTGQLTLIEEIGEKALNRNDVEDIVRNKDFKDLTEKQLKRIDELLDAVKICDPAIGSGAFPMGLLKEIFGIKELIAYMTDAEWNPSQVKLNIIQNSIYGVDIEKGAVDIARLRFWLSLIVDEEYPKPLPNLDYKIVVGDSLISKFENEIIEIDWNRKSNVGKADEYIKNVQKYLKEVATKQREYFNPKNKNKKMLQSDIRNLKIELLINQVKFNKEYFISNNEIKGGFMPSASDQKHNLEIDLQIANFNNLVKKLENLKNNLNAPFSHFDWKLDFPEILNPYLIIDEKERGFDILIGNPPYGADLSDSEKEIYKKLYSDVHMRTPDTFNYFISNSHRLTKLEGVVSFIVPNNLLYQTEYEKTRRFLIQNNKLISAINLGDGIFESATIPSCIFLTQKSNDKNYSDYFYADLREMNTSMVDFCKFVTKHNIKQIIEVPALVFGVSSDDFYILKRLTDRSQTIDDLALEVASGISTGGDKIFRITKEKAEELNLEKDLLKPVLVGGEIDSYSIKYKDFVLIYSNRTLDINKYKNIKNYIESYKSVLLQRSESKSGLLPWFALGRQRYPELFQEPKIIMRQTSDCIRATYDVNGYYVLNSIIVVKLKEETIFKYKYCLGMLNSKINQFAYKKFTQEVGRTFAEVKPKNVRKLFIPRVDNEMQEKFIKLVDYILYLRARSLADITEQFVPVYFEQIIDGIAYEIYFSDLLIKHKREIIKYLGVLPDINNVKSAEEKMTIIKDVFERLNQKDHPVRTNLFFMNTIPEIAIIEGKK